MKTQLTIEIDAEQKKKLKIFATLRDKTMKSIIFEALTMYLESQQNHE